jgi:hypothetical protein
VCSALVIPYSTARSTLDLSIRLHLVEDKFRAELARELELREQQPDLALLDVLEAVVRLQLVLVRVHHLDP